MRGMAVRRAALFVGGLTAAVLAGPALAQAPPPMPPEAAEIRDCLCLKATVDALGADMGGREATLAGIREELAQLDDQLQRERQRMDVNNPESVARFRQLLERRDAMFQRSTGAAFAALRQATDRYGAAAADYNARCANRPRDPVLLSRVQATLACPPLR